MSVATVEAALIKVTDHLAKLRQLYQGVNGGTSINDIEDGAADVIYENRCWNQNATDLEAAIAAAAFGDTPAWAAWWRDKRAYFTNSTTSATPGLGYSSSTPGWNTYLAARALRVAYEFAELYYDQYNSRIDPQYVFPKGTYAASGPISAVGLHKFGDVTRAGGVWPSVLSNMTDGALPTTVQGAGVILVSEAGSGATALTVNAVLQDKTTAIAIDLTGLTMTANTQYLAGEQALTANPAAGQKVITSAGILAKAIFTEGDWVIIYEAGVGEEMAQVDTIATNTITMVSDLVRDFSGSAKVVPLFYDVTGLSDFTGGSDSDAIQVYAKPDRIIAL